MSVWRRIARTLYALDAPATTQEVGKRLGGLYATDASIRSRAMSECGRLGVIRKANGKWHLTAIGTAWCEGRMTQVRRYRGGSRWVPTWLESLPRDIRIGAAAGAGTGAAA